VIWSKKQKAKSKKEGNKGREARLVKFFRSFTSIFERKEKRLLTSY